MKWISVKKILPSSTREVWVYDLDNLEAYVAHYLIDTWMDNRKKIPLNFNVTHWAEIELPKDIHEK